MPLARIDLAEGNPANYRRTIGEDLRIQRPCGARIAAGVIGSCDSSKWKAGKDNDHRNVVHRFGAPRMEVKRRTCGQAVRRSVARTTCQRICPGKKLPGLSLGETDP